MNKINYPVKDGLHRLPNTADSLEESIQDAAQDGAENLLPVFGESALQKIGDCLESGLDLVAVLYDLGNKLGEGIMIIFPPFQSGISPLRRCRAIFAWYAFMPL